VTSPATGDTVEGELIGTTGGPSTLDNGGDGVAVEGPLEVGNVIGGTAPGAGNTIAGNRASGVYFGGVGANNVVEDDVITGNGSEPSLSVVGQDYDGVYLVGAPGTTVVTGCTIESNDGWGIFLKASGSSKTTGNTIPSKGSTANKLGTIGSSP
jgi:parallel beta-helix repeat protein